MNENYYGLHVDVCSIGMERERYRQTDVTVGDYSNLSKQIN